jgi:hypothetical protein
LKRLFLAAISLATISAYAQEDAYAKLQGVWYAETKDGNTYFIFENHTAIIAGEEMLEPIIEIHNFIVSSNVITFYLKHCLGVDPYDWMYSDKSSYEWKYAGPEEIDNVEFSGKFEAYYEFSGAKLMLTVDGVPFTLSKMD